MANHTNRHRPNTLADFAQAARPAYLVGPDWEPPCTARPQAQDRQRDELRQLDDEADALDRLKPRPTLDRDRELPLDLYLGEPWHGARRRR